MTQMTKHLSKKLVTLVVIIAAIALVIVGYLLASLQSKETITVNAVSIEERLSKCSDLTTARLNYRGLIRYSEGDIKYLTQKSFSMIYDATITAGIDLSQAEVTLDDTSIKVVLPQPTIQSIIIDPDSLEFYDEKAALFNWTEKEDTQKAMSYAKEDASAKAEQVDLLTQASEQAESVVTNLLLPFTEDSKTPYTVTVTFK